MNMTKDIGLFRIDGKGIVRKVEMVEGKKMVVLPNDFSAEYCQIYPCHPVLLND